MLAFKLALIGEDIVVLPLEEADGSLRDDAVLLAQRDEPAVEGEDGIIILALCLDIDGVPVVKPADSPAVHCIGVRPLSRERAPIIFIVSSSERPEARRMSW